MSDYLASPGMAKSIGMSSKRLKSCLIASSPFSTSKKPFVNLKRIQVGGPSGQVIWFLLKVAALDVARRLSRRKCPIVWHAIQSLFLLYVPPFKWFQKWEPLQGLVKVLKALSKPLLFLSVARTVVNNSQKSKCTVISNPPLEPSRNDISSGPSAEPLENTSSSNQLIQLREELRSQGLLLPERFNDNELHRFVIASDGNFARLHRSLKRTIHWRETYQILSLEELAAWSDFMFWHGTDVRLRPCLVIRLGLACLSPVIRSTPSFVDALVSQIEYGVVNLLNKEDPTVTVLVDCQGLTPLRFPMKMLRSCAMLMQEHYPNCLATLLVIRLPPIARVLAQTFLQVLNPATRQKLHVGGEAYQKFLSEFLLSTPSFLGGQCTCSRCSDSFPPKVNGLGYQRSQSEVSKVDDGPSERAPLFSISLPHEGNFDQALGNTVVSILLLWIILVVLMGMHGSGHLSILGSS